jgi:superfamily II DNA or RNA helicase
MITMFTIEDLDNLDLNNFGVFGKSYELSESKPTIIELCRFCMPDEKFSKRLLKTFQNNSSDQKYKEFKKRYFGNSEMKILQNYWHEVNAELQENPKQFIYHSNRRKWLSIVENTKLRDYQLECLNTIKQNYQSFLEGQKTSTLLILPTGAGKTKTVVQSIRDIIDSNKEPLHILWMVHTSPLCEQAENAIQSSWVEPRENTNYKSIWVNSVYGSGIKMTKAMFGKVPSFTISTPDSIEKGDWGFELKGVFDIVVCDEAHHGVKEQHRVFMENWPNAHRIGITATPNLVTSQKEFNKLYSVACWPERFVKANKGKTWKDTKEILIQNKYLSDYGIIADKDMRHETDTLHLEFKPKSIWSEQAATILVAAKLSKEMLDSGCKRLLLFVDGVEQARAISGHLRDKGINTSAIYGALSSDERNSRINGFSSGHFQVLVSVNILREGIDVPLVDGILIMRRSLQQNSPMFTQIIGRGLRGPRSGGTEKCLVWHIT